MLECSWWHYVMRSESGCVPHRCGVGVASGPWKYQSITVGSTSIGKRTHNDQRSTVRAGFYTFLPSFRHLPRNLASPARAHEIVNKLDVILPGSYPVPYAPTIEIWAVRLFRLLTLRHHPPLSETHVHMNYLLSTHSWWTEGHAFQSIRLRVDKRNKSTHIV